MHEQRAIHTMRAWGDRLNGRLEPACVSRLSEVSDAGSSVVHLPRSTCLVWTLTTSCCAVPGCCEILEKAVEGSQRRVYDEVEP